jgi:hypothetical protein
MLTDEQIGDVLSRELSELTGDISPRADLADRVVSARRGRRRRTQAAAGSSLVAAAAVAGVALGTGGSSRAPRLAAAKLHLASYRFTMPRGSRVADADAVAATSPSCAMGAFIVYTSGPNEGATSADQPAIQNAVTSSGGCVSMLLTDPFTPGAANAPRPFFYPVQTSSVTIDGDSGTVGTYEVLGGSGLTIHGVPVTNGTENTELFLQIPTTNGQVRELEVAAAGVSESQLQAIVASGLSAN